MQFLIDENLPSEVAELLRQAGHDAVMVLDCVHAGTLDPSVAALCVAQKRALITLDVGFGNTQLHPPQDYFGIMVLRPDTQDKPHVLAVIAALLPKLVEEELVGKLWVVHDRVCDQLTWLLLCLALVDPESTRTTSPCANW